MTLFVTTRKRVLEINEAYAMGVSFLTFFAVGKIFKAVIEKQKTQHGKAIKISNPIGGYVGIEFSDDTELAHTILTCIADNERYIVKDPEIIKLIFALVRAKIKNDSLVVTPNMIRFLALKLINNNQTLIVKIGNIVISSSNKGRLFTRMAGSAIIGLGGALVGTLSYAILLMLLFFNATENCSYRCSDYFEQLPREGPTQIYGEESIGHLVIAGNDDARQVEIYIPSKGADEVAVRSTGELKITKTYREVRKKAKQVKFSDFKQTDPVLSSFKDLKEPTVPQKSCPIHDVPDVMNIYLRLNFTLS